MSTRAGQWRSTQRFSLTDEAGSFEVSGTVVQTYGVTASPAPRAFFVCSNQPAHISRVGTATQSDLYLPADTPIVIDCYAAENISYILDAAGSDSGYIWFTLIDHT
jgi:hypothetical protein